MASSVLCIFASAWASAGAYRVDRKAITEAARVQTSAEQQGAVAASSLLSSDVEEAFLAAGLARFHAVQLLRNSTTLADQVDGAFLGAFSGNSGAAFSASIDMVSSLPGTHPMWPELRAKMKASIRTESIRSVLGGIDFIGIVENKQWDLYLDKACNLGAGAPLVKQNASSPHPFPIDAYFCGNHEIDWSGAPWNGKPIVDLCNAQVGDASTVNVCGKFTDKEVVLGVLVNITEDPRMTNIVTLDCLMDTMDGDIYYCHKCAGRCHGW